jgi:hypothetical protein
MSYTGFKLFMFKKTVKNAFLSKNPCFAGERLRMLLKHNYMTD